MFPWGLPEEPDLRQWQKDVRSGDEEEEEEKEEKDQGSSEGKKQTAGWTTLGMAEVSFPVVITAITWTYQRLSKARNTRFLGIKDPVIMGSQNLQKPQVMPSLYITLPLNFFLNIKKKYIKCQLNHLLCDSP